MSGRARFLPLALLVLLLVGLVWRLATPADTTISSKLDGRPVPAFDLPPALQGRAGLTAAMLADGKPHLVNIFASWCVPCATEVGRLGGIKRRGFAVEGIAIRDRPDDLARFLAQHGDPYDRIGSDQRSQVQIALGSSGVPESFVVDGRGIVRYQHIGPIEAGDVAMVVGKLGQAR